MSRLATTGLLISLLLGGSMWFYVAEILVPHQKQYAAEHGIPRGNLSDLYPRWLGSRELLLHGRDPYSSEITREIQYGYYGRPLDSSRRDDPSDEERFAYPVYVAFLLAPLITLPFSVVQTVFTVIITALAILSVFLWLRILGWPFSPVVSAIILILTLGSFGVIQGIKLQQITLLVVGLLTAGIAALVSERMILAGFLLALATIKPQLALPLAGWLMIWSFSDLRSRWRFIAGFLISLCMFFFAGNYVLPGWISRFADAIIQYRRYTGGAGSVLDVLLSSAVGRILALLIALFVAMIGWRERHSDVKSGSFAGVTALVLTATVVVVPMTAPYNQILLLPAILLILRSLPTLWTSGRLHRFLLCVTAAILLEPFFSALALTFIAPLTTKTILLGFWAVPLYTSLTIPVAVFALLLLTLRLDNAGSYGSPASRSPA